MCTPLIFGNEFPWFFQKSNPTTKPKPIPIPKFSFTQHESTGKKLTPSQIQPIQLTDLALQYKEELNQKWDHHLKQVLDALIQQQGIPLDETQKQNLQQIFEKLSFENITMFFDHLVEKAAENDTRELVEIALEAVPLHPMINLLKEKYPQNFVELEEWIQTVASCLPEELPPTMSREEHLEASRSSNVVTRFFPNLSHIFLRAFDLFDTARPPDTLYEYGVLVTLYFHFFQIPYILFQGLSALLTSPVHVVVTATSILGMAVGLLYVYLRWGQKRPEKVSYCENRSEKFQRGEFEPVLCREAEYAEGLGCLGNGKHHTRVNFVIIGEPGCGKTEWINGLPAHLPDKTIYAFQNSQLFGGGFSSKSAAEKMEDAFRDVRFYENEVVFVCDELGDAFANNPKDLAAFLKPVLGNRSIQFIAVMTKEQWEGVKKEDKAFEERFKPITLEPTQDVQTERILADRVRRCAKDIYVTHAALLKIIEETNKLQGHSQPRKAIGVLNELINKVHQFNPENYSTPELRAAQDELSNLLLQSAWSDHPLRDPFSESSKKYLEKLNEAKEKVACLEAVVNTQKELIRKIVKCFRHDKYYQEMMHSAARQLTSPRLLEEPEKERLQKRFVFSNFFAFQKLKSSIDKLLKELRDDVYVCINTTAVEAVLTKVAPGDTEEKIT